MNDMNNQRRWTIACAALLLFGAGLPAGSAEPADSNDPGPGFLCSMAEADRREALLDVIPKVGVDVAQQLAELASEQCIEFCEKELDSFDANARVCVPVPSTNVGTGPYVSASSSSVPDVFAGQVTSIVWFLNTTSPVGSVIEVAPLVSPASTASCSIISASLRGGFELADATYYLASSALAASLRAHVAPIEQAYRDETNRPIDLQGSLPSAQIVIDVKLRASEDSVAGSCLLNLDVTETFPQVAQPVHQTFGAVFDILPEVQLPVEMGLIKTYGAWLEDDYARVETPALPEWTVVTYKTRATVPLVGLLAHDDGNDNGDFGEFWFTLGGISIGNTTKIAEPDDGVSHSLEVSLTPGINNQPIVYDACYHGRYVDGGLYNEIDGQASTCTRISVLKIAPGAMMALAAANGVDAAGLSTFALPGTPTSLGIGATLLQAI